MPWRIILSYAVLTSIFYRCWLGVCSGENKIVLRQESVFPEALVQANSYELVDNCLLLSSAIRCPLPALRLRPPARDGCRLFSLLFCTRRYP